MDAIAPGRVLNGKWTVGAPLGQGGGGVVYEASHRNGIRAAVKILHPSLAMEADKVARFLREGAIANHLEHVGAVAALDDDRTEDGLVYIVFERVDGTTLAEVIEARAPLEAIEALTLTDKILDVLVAAHGKGILHRDVKPANVVVLPSGEVKLLDFGLARAGVLGSNYLVNPTANGAILGTLGFMAPEQASGQTELVDERSDLWAVAAVLFTMLTRERLHAPGRGGHALPIRSVRSSVLDVVARIVDRGLSREREDRFQTAVRMQGAVRFALTNLVAGTSAAALPASAPSSSLSSRPLGVGRPAPHAKRRHVAMTIAVAILGAAALGGFGWLAATSARPEPGPSGTLRDAGSAR